MRIVLYAIIWLVFGGLIAVRMVHVLLLLLRGRGIDGMNTKKEECVTIVITLVVAILLTLGVHSLCGVCSSLSAYHDRIGEENRLWNELGAVNFSNIEISPPRNNIVIHPGKMIINSPESDVADNANKDVFFSLPEEKRATSLKDFDTIVIVHWSQKLYAYYDDSSKGLRLTCNVSVVDKKTLTLIAEKCFQGIPPPEKKEKRIGSKPADSYGKPPAKEMAEYLDSL